MGISGSTNKTTKNDIVKESITNVLNKVTSSCTAVSSNTQTNAGNSLTISGLTNSKVSISVLQDISSKLNAKCIQQNVSMTDLTKQIEDELTSKVNDTSSGLFSGKAFSSTDITELNTLKSSVVSNINIQSLTECLSTSSNQQSNLDNVVKILDSSGVDLNIDTTQKIISEVVNECIQSNQALSKASDALNSKLDSLVDTSSKGVDVNGIVNSIADTFKSAFSAVSTPLIVGIIASVVVFIVLAVLFVKSPHLMCYTPLRLFIGSTCSSKNNQKNPKYANGMQVPMYDYGMQGTMYPGY